MKEQRPLLYDLEVSRAVAEGYGTKWEFKVVKFIRPQILMCYAYKYLGDKKSTFVSMHDFKTYKGFVQSLADLLNSSPVVIAHNGVDFDNKMSNTFFVTERIDPPKPFRSIDTLKVARSVFKFPSNSLNDLAEFLGLKGKEKITYADLEDEFITKPSRRVLRLMSRYNRRDVDLLEEVYLIERPYMKNHPNLAVSSGGKFVCPRCQSTDLQKRGTYSRGTGTFQAYKCNNCKSWPSERLSMKGVERPPLV